jgi:hypothetical protein
MRHPERALVLHPAQTQLIIVYDENQQRLAD